MNILNELTYLGTYLGSRLDLVQAGGGNISIKDEGKVYIKSSGCSLSEINQNYGYSIIEKNNLDTYLSNLSKLDEKTFGESLSNLANESSRRPSIETPMHGVVSDKVVIHVHPISVLSIVSRRNGQKFIKENFPDAIWIPYVTPGLSLAKSFQERYKKGANLLFLENHGVVVSAKTVSEAIGLLENVINICEEKQSIKFDKTSSEIVTYLFKKHKEHFSVYTNENQILIDTFQKLNLEYFPSCPDDVIYIGKSIFKSDSINSDEFKKFIEVNHIYPKVIYLNDQLYFLGKNIQKARQVFEQFFANIISAIGNQKVQGLSANEINFLGGWEAEKYRQNLNTKG